MSWSSLSPLLLLAVVSVLLAHGVWRQREGARVRVRVLNNHDRSR